MNDDQLSMFEESRAPEEKGPAWMPLAARMRPRTLEEIVGQEHLTRKDGLLTKLIKSNRFGSLIFYGPPGTGKTSFAEVIAQETKSRFVRINAVMSNVAELRQILAAARHRRDGPTLLFIDELHRFNKSQQDLLLPDVEAGYIRLIGATTHNPGFYVNPPLLSRSHLFRLESLSVDAVAEVLERALNDEERGLGKYHCTANPEVLRDLAVLCDGDLRRALNALEVIVLTLDEGSEITEKELEVFARERKIRYDANEDEHYDTASAFIKSCRGGDPDAALYWLAKMLEGGEDPRFIARRLVILSSEDVGLADPFALPLAVAAHHAVEFVGMPEAELILAHATVHIACAPKSNSTTMAIYAAKQSLKSGVVQKVPLHLRDAHTKTNKSMGHGKDYLYSHEFPEAISGQEYMEKPMQFYHPSENGLEVRVAQRLERWRALKEEIQNKQKKAKRNPARSNPNIP